MSHSDLAASSRKRENMEMTGCDLPLEVGRVGRAPGKVGRTEECHPAPLTRKERTQGSEVTVRAEAPDADKKEEGRE